MSGFSGYLKALGPGLLWAATAIGVSHLVQSTRAGALYGFSLVGVVVLVNLLKYPLFEAGPRYAVATGRSLIEGYVAQGRWAVGVYLVVTVGTMFTVLAAVTLVTGGLAQALFGAALSAVDWSAVALAICALVLVVGRFPLLDRVIKAIIVLLALSTLIAFVVALERFGEAPASPPLELDGPTIAFLVALLGWMPTGMDAAAWHSLWTLERGRQTAHRASWREARFDFNLGYFGTVAIALAFLTLGALVLRPSGAPLAGSAGGFAAQLVEVYVATLGEWSRPVLLVAAFTTMFSTTLAVSDGFPRVLAHLGSVLLRPAATGSAGDALRDPSRAYWPILAVLMLGALGLIVYLQRSFTTLIDLATTLSFLTAPVIGYLNLRAVCAPEIPSTMRPPGWWRGVAWSALALLGVLGAVYLWIRLVAGS